MQLELKGYLVTNRIQYVNTVFSWDIADPIAVKMTMEDVNGPVSWTYARDLLRGGGEGDVVVTYRPTSEVYIKLRSPDGEVTIAYDGGEIWKYLVKTYQKVSGENESAMIDWDSEFIFLLDTEPGQQ